MESVLRMRAPDLNSVRMKVSPFTPLSKTSLKLNLPSIKIEAVMFFASYSEDDGAATVNFLESRFGKSIIGIFLDEHASWFVLGIISL